MKQYGRIEGGSKLGSFISPMLATLSDDPAFDNPKWIYEIKWDGYRAVAELNGNDTRFYSRNGLTYQKAYPKVFNELVKIKTKAVIDGEVVVYDHNGKPSFNAIQNYNSRQNVAIQYQVFDCLELEGKDISKLQLVQRKELLKELLPESGIIKYCDHIEEQGMVLFEHASKIGLEGSIAKRADSKYFVGKRTKEWLKIKNALVEEFVITGWTDPQSSRKYFGALIIARKDKGKLIYAGEVGTGFTDKMLKDLYEKLKAKERRSSAMADTFKVLQSMHFVDPFYVCEVQYTEITADGHVRHPSFLRLK
jgi:bifunctional non-homologous end joining protein LigD